MAKELGSIIDVETTGVDSTKDKITEIGVLQFEYDPEQFKDSPGAPELTITGMYAGLQDPGRPLTAEIVKLTGLTDKVLAGKKIDYPPAQGVNVTFEKAPKAKTTKGKQQKLGIE